MATNYATKYADKIQKIFTLGSLTEAAVNKNFSWVGVNAINVFSITTQALTDYTVTGTNRYGTPTELQNEVQTMLLAKDRSFSTTIDQMTLDDTNGAIKVGEFLKTQIEEQITPEIDEYRIKTMYDAAIANSAYASAVILASNAYSSFLTGQETLGDAKVPNKGRLAFISYAFYSFIKLDSTFMLASEVAMKDRVNGMAGMVDGVKLIPVPSSYLPSNVAFLLTHPVATVAAEKLTEYKTNMKAPGISGALIEGRVRYDAFVLDTKVDAIYVHSIGAIS